MEIRPYFEKIEDVIIEDIMSSKQQLLIAVAWFTNHKIFDAIIEKLDGNDNFTAKLIVINDNINHRVRGLDFQRFVSAGGCLYFAEKNIPMHNKYMVIDSDIVITGSYNYTYYAETLNEENVVRIKGDCEIVQSYIKNFDNLVSKKPKVTGVSEYLRAFPPAVDLFAYNNYGKKDMSLQADIFSKMGGSSEVQVIMEKVETAVNEERHEYFVINDVIYKQWKDCYYVDKIEVRKDIITVFFRSFVETECSLFSPETTKAWIIQSSNNKDIMSRSHAVRNVRFNGEMVLEEAQNGTVYEFYNEEEPKTNDKSESVQSIKIPKGGIITCEVLFKTENLELIDGTIDFIEGRYHDTSQGHWNAFSIQMYKNREWL